MHKKSRRGKNTHTAPRLVRSMITIFLLLIHLSAYAGDPNGPRHPHVIDVGTGSQTGVYYPAGSAICNLLMADQPINHQITCRALSTGGSIYNLTNVSSGKLQLGIAQADTLYRAWKGEAPFKDKAVKLRVLFAIHEEMLTLAVRRDAEISSFRRIQGKRLNVGPEGSGNERVVSEMFKACKIFPGDLGLMGRLKTSKVPQAMISRKLDGYFYVVGHPNSSFAQAANSMPLEIIPLDGRCIKKLVKTQPYFDITTVPGGLYRGVDRDISTFGVKAWVVSSTDVSEGTTYHIVQRVFENLDAFRKQNPAFYRLSPRKMLKRIDIPYHRGALRYFKEKEWYED